MANFNFYLNRQGVQGRRGEKGDKGDKGFSPYIDIKTNTPTEFIMTVHNELENFDTPNLIPTEIGNKVAELESEVNFLSNDIDKNTSDISVANLEIDELEKKVESKQNQLVAGENITLTPNSNGTVTISSEGSGSGDVTAAGNNTFIGENTFTDTVTNSGTSFNGERVKGGNVIFTMQEIPNGSVLKVGEIGASPSGNLNIAAEANKAITMGNSEASLYFDKTGDLSANAGYINFTARNDIGLTVGDGEQVQISRDGGRTRSSVLTVNNIKEGSNISLTKDETTGDVTISSTASGGSSSELDNYIEGSTNNNTTTITAKDGKALELSAPTVIVGNNLVNTTDSARMQLYLKQGDVSTGSYITVERTATGIKLTGTPPTDISDLEARTSTLESEYTNLSNEVNSQAGDIAALDADKQNKLTAGENISLVDNEDGTVTISATGGSTGDTPIATTEVAGKVKPDGTTITVDEDGTIHSVGGSGELPDNMVTTDTVQDIKGSKTFLSNANDNEVGILFGNYYTNGSDDIQNGYIGNYRGQVRFSTGSPTTSNNDVVVDLNNGTRPTIDLFSMGDEFPTLRIGLLNYLSEIKHITPDALVLTNRATNDGNGYSQLTVGSDTLEYKKNDGTTIDLLSNGFGSSTEKYGIQGDYATRHGIIDNPNGIIEFSATSKEIKVKQGLVLNCAGNGTAKTTISSDITHTVESTGAFTLFYADGNLLECGKVDYSTEEPADNGVANYQAWFNPDKETNLNQQWQFKSNDTGNVWRYTNSATPLADFVASETGITSVSYISYRITDDDVYAHVNKDNIFTGDNAFSNGTIYLDKYKEQSIKLIEGSLIATTTNNCITLRSANDMGNSFVFNGDYGTIRYSDFSNYPTSITDEYFVRTDKVIAGDGIQVTKGSNGQVTISATGGSSEPPANMVTTDTVQEIAREKIFKNGISLTNTAAGYTATASQDRFLSDSPVVHLGTTNEDAGTLQLRCSILNKLSPDAMTAERILTEGDEGYLTSLASPTSNNNENINFDIPASGTALNMPKDGHLMLAAKSSGVGDLIGIITSSGLGTQIFSSGSNQSMHATLPVAKNTTATILYSPRMTVQYLRLVPAKGAN